MQKSIFPKSSSRNTLKSFSYKKGDSVMKDCGHSKMTTIVAKDVPEEIEPSLANWEKWLSIHRKTQEMLSNKVERSPRCLLMNSDLNSLYVNQEKLRFTEASDLEHCDKFRGHPNFWKTDDNFKRDGKSLGVYQPLHKKYDRSSRRHVTDQCPELPKAEYVGVPDAILKEKGLTGEPCLTTPKDKWEKSEYVNVKRIDLDEKLKAIQAHKPEVLELAVVGRAISEQKGKDRIDESVHKGNQLTTTSSPRTLEFTPSNLSVHSYVSVYVDEYEVTKNKHPWNIEFHQDCFVNETYKKTLTIVNNQKDTCLRYCWEMVVPGWADSELPLRYLKQYSKSYFFDRRDGVILPNGEKPIEIQFHSSVAGVFCETWQLQLSHRPDEWNGFPVVLEAVAVERPNCTEDLDGIEAYVESCTRLTVARKTVEEILQRTRPELPQALPYDWKFFEEQIFLHNNPDLFYDNKCVLRLKNLHEELCLGPWDFSVKSLREELLKLPLGENARGKIEVFTKIVYQLMKPSLTTVLPSEKHKTVYELMCCFVNKMDAESRNLKIAIGIPVVRFSEEMDISAQSSVSAKIGSMRSQTSKILSGKRSLKTSKTPSRMNSVLLSKTFDTGDSLVSGVPSSKSEYDVGPKKKQEYLDAFYIKTYTLLADAVDHISAFLESFDAQPQKRTGLHSFKLARPYSVSK